MKTKKALTIVTVLLIALAISFSFISCVNKYSKEFKETIEKVNDQCPYPIGGGLGTGEAVKLEDGYVVYYYYFADSDNEIVKNYKRNKELMKKQMGLSFLVQNGIGNSSGTQTLDMLIENKCGVKHHVRTQSGEQFEVALSLVELKDIKRKYDMSTSDAMAELMRVQIEMQRTSLPLMLEEGLYLADITMDSDDLSRIYELDENIYDIDEFEAVMAEIKKGNLNQGEIDPSEQAFYHLCKTSHIGLKDVFIGKQSGKKFEIRTSSHEIQENIKLPAVFGLK